MNMVDKESLIAGLLAGFTTAATIAVSASLAVVLGGELSPPSIGGDEFAIGARTQNGTAYAGISPDTQRPLYTTPADAPGTYTFEEAKSNCAGLDVNGHDDWRVPSKGELNVLFQNRAAIGGFDEGGSFQTGRYWAAAESAIENDHTGAWSQRFSDGEEGVSGKVTPSSLRCVR